MENQNYHVQGLKHPPPQVVVVMVPLPAQGHLNPFLHLSRLISSYDFPVHFVGFEIHNRQAKLRIHGWDPLTKENIHFHDFPTPSFPSPPPDPNSSTKFPSHFLPSFYATSHLRHPVNTLLQTLSTNSRRIIVIHDYLMGSVVQDVPSISNAESYIFQCTAAFTLFTFISQGIGKPFPVDEGVAKALSCTEACFTSEFLEFSDSQVDHLKLSSGSLYNSSKVIEGEYLGLLKEHLMIGNKYQWTIGPLNPLVITKKSNQNGQICLDWLDKQDPSSVIFVSFGSTTSLCDEQIRELAEGLEQSEQKFIWVLRDADKGNVFDGEEVRKAELPNGFEERIRGRGVIVRDWAPQLEILCHESTGGFMTHCGWNSCIESISMGVPVVAWPMHSDQPANAILMTDVLKIGILIREWTNGNEVVSSLTIEKAVTTLMASPEGEGMRKRAAELSMKVKESVSEGGVSRLELDSFVAHINR